MEQWKTVVHNGEVFEGYEVSTLGNVRSLSYDKTQEVKILSLNKSSRYLRVTLFKNGKRRKLLVHRLVACTFIPNPDNKPTVNHINENKHDNRVENLEWATHKEQSGHGTLQERKAKARTGQKHTEQTKQKMRNKSKKKRVRCINTGQEFESCSQASRELKVDVSDLCKCCKGLKQDCKGLKFEYITNKKGDKL